MKTFKGNVIALEYDDSNEINQIIVTLLGKPEPNLAPAIANRELIAVWTSEQWKNHPNQKPAVGDGFTITSWVEEVIDFNNQTVESTPKYEIQWIPRQIEPWSDELIERLKNNEPG